MECKAQIKYISPTLNGADLILHIADPKGIEELQDADLRLTLTKWRERRSKDANAYFHVLCGKLAEAVGMSKPCMKNMLLFRYGQRARDRDGNLVVIKSNADEAELLESDSIHCWPTAPAPDGTPMYIVLGKSRYYDTKEMSLLIDGTVNEFKAMGIDTMTPDEINELKEKWGV